jgi:hypothetical protein
MRIAYIVLVHQYPDQVVRLVHKLKTENTSFFIHIDRKAAPSIYYAIVNEIGRLPNVYLLKRHNCYWGELGHVNATIEGIKALLNSKTVFDYTILLTGQCYPLKANSDIETFLNANQGFSLMEYFPLPLSWRLRIEKWHIRFLSKKFIVPKRQSDLSIKRRFPSGLEPFGGSAYWCLSRECIEYIDKFVHHNRSFVNFFRFSFAPDEMFFQTILLNSPLKHTIINDNYWYIKWLPAAAKPTLLGAADFETMITSSKLFARKFDATQDTEILDRLARAQ